jgi:4-carboxymuconolactone decarboxylase
VKGIQNAMPKTSARKPAVRPATKPKPSKQKPSRLPQVAEANYSPEQRALVDAIQSGPRGRTVIQGPFGVFIHAPGYGQFAQALGGHVRLRTGVPPRLSEFAILMIGSLWRAQFEWYAHAPIAEKAGVAPETIKAIHAGRAPKKLPKDEQAIYDFVSELHKTRRVSDRTYKRVQSILGDKATVELVGILGYYTLVAMTLNVFRMPLPAGEVLPFTEK